MKYLLLSCLLLIFYAGRAQPKGYDPGYIVKKENDTIYGWVKDRKTGYNNKLYKKIRFKSYRGRRSKFDTSKITGYQNTNGVYVSIWFDEEWHNFKPYYYSIQGQGEKIFMKLLIDD